MTPGPRETHGHQERAPHPGECIPLPPAQQTPTVLPKVVFFAAARQLAPSGVRFVGVDVADNAASARAYMQRYGLRYPSLSDPGDRIAAEFNQIMPVAAFPSTLVIAPDGRITGRVIGAASDHDLRRHGGCSMGAAVGCRHEHA
jgi:Redoxin